jgi:hypothetical protein
MSVLINAYCTLRDPPALDFPHALNNRRDLTDPELAPHLNGFCGYVMSKLSGKMTQNTYHVLRHIQRVRHHLSLNVEEEDLDDFSRWALEANAISFLPDGSVRDPWGNVLIDPAGGAPGEGAEVPYPPDARQRKARHDEHLRGLGISTPATLPPVVGEAEAEFRPAREVALRALALFNVALRAESLAIQDPLPVERLRKDCRPAFEALSPAEEAFLAAEAPGQQDIINFAWRYEALFLLEWALGLVDEMPFPSRICDVPLVARTMLDRGHDAILDGASLRPAGELLDALDLHLRLHWAARQARLDKREAPAGLDEGVIRERHHALNWLVRFENADWDDIDTPT